MYHSLISRRSNIGVAKSRFDRCSPRAWWMIQSPCTLRRACTPASCGYTCFLSRRVAGDHPGKQHQVVAPCPSCSGPIRSRTRLDRCLQCLPSPAPRRSLGPPLRNVRGARGVLDHTDVVPPGAHAGATHDRSRTPRLPGCRPGRRRGGSRNRAPSPAPDGILQRVTRRLVRYARCHSFRLLSLRIFHSRLFLLPPIH